ncbi:MAG: 2OG-Fe(II) oxygenase [Acidimicrobiia bacterium]|nr:2OG-Fe(II) oxygenase [Acidimicrobiia bacterium]
MSSASDRASDRASERASERAVESPIDPFIALDRHPIDDPVTARRQRETLDRDGALVLAGFFTPTLVAAVLDQSLPRIDEAFFTVDRTHNVYLTPPDPTLADSHVFNRQIVSTKGCLAHDQIPADSPLRAIYDSPRFQLFLCRLLGIESIHPYADNVSGINVHFHLDGQELGWHFDNSSFAVTALMQAPESGGTFDYVPDLRDADRGDQNFDGVEAVLNQSEQRMTSAGKTATSPIRTLDFDPGALVLFRGRNSLHRVTPSRGSWPRVLVVFAYNTEPGIGLSEAAKQTFYGRSR